MDRPFEKSKLIKLINSSSDRIPYEFFVNDPSYLADKLIIVFNIIFANNILSDVFKDSIIFPLYEKDDSSEVLNNRGEMFCNTVA